MAEDILTPESLFLLTPPVETRGFLTFFYCVHTFCGLSGWGGGVMLMFLGSVTWHTLGLGWGGWGDVNVPWKRYVTYAGVGVGGGGVMLTFLGSVTWHTLGLGWGGWGDVNVPWKRYVTNAGVGVGEVGWCQRSPVTYFWDEVDATL